MNLRQCVFLLSLFPLSAWAQGADSTAQHYAVRYVKEHLFMQHGDDFNVIDTDIEWPEIISYNEAAPLQCYMARQLMGVETNNLDSVYTVTKERLGRPVTGQLTTLPDDNRFCYVTFSAKILSYSPGRWFSMKLVSKAEPASLSSVRAVSKTRYVTYDIGRRQVLETENIVKDRAIWQGSVNQGFFDQIFQPLSDQMYDDMVYASIDGAYPDETGAQVTFNISCRTTTQQLNYDVTMPYESVRYVVSKPLRRLIEKKPVALTPQYFSLPDRWQGMPVYKSVEERPVFQGGQEGLKQYISRMSTQEQGISGRVTVAFVVDTCGNVQDVRVVKHLSPEADRHAAAVVRNMPRYTPGKIEGQPVCTRMYVPIYYKENQNQADHTR